MVVGRLQLMHGIKRQRTIQFQTICASAAFLNLASGNRAALKVQLAAIYRRPRDRVVADMPMIQFHILE